MSNIKENDMTGEETNGYAKYKTSYKKGDLYKKETHEAINYIEKNYEEFINYFSHFVSSSIIFESGFRFTSTPVEFFK